MTGLAALASRWPSLRAEIEGISGYQVPTLGSIGKLSRHFMEYRDQNSGSIARDYRGDQNASGGPSNSGDVFPSRCGCRLRICSRGQLRFFTGSSAADAGIPDGRFKREWQSQNQSYRLGL